MIDILQSLTSVKPDVTISSIEKSSQMCIPSFIYVLSPQANISTSSKQPTNQTIYTSIKYGSSRSGKLTKALPNSPIFTNRKDLPIDQLLSKMRGKFEIN